MTMARNRWATSRDAIQGFLDLRPGTPLTWQEHGGYIKIMNDHEADLNKRLERIEEGLDGYLSQQADPEDPVHETQVTNARAMYRTAIQEIIALRNQFQRALEEDDRSNRPRKLQIENLDKLNKYKISDHVPEFSGTDPLQFNRWLANADKAISELREFGETDANILMKLRSTLKGQAKAVIDGYEDSDANLMTVLTVLKNRFLERHNEMIALVSRLIKASDMTTSIGSVTKTVNEWINARARLEDIRVGPPNNLRRMTPQEMLNAVWMSILEMKMDKGMRAHWLDLIERKRDTTHFFGADVSIEDMQQFALSYVNRLETIQGPDAHSSHKHKGKPNKGSLPKNFMAKSSDPCIFCQEAHRSLTCNKQPSVEKTFDALMRERICLGCGLPYSKGHNKVCKITPCGVDDCTGHHQRRFHYLLKERMKQIKGNKNKAQDGQKTEKKSNGKKKTQPKQAPRRSPRLAEKEKIQLMNDGSEESAPPSDDEVESKPKTLVTKRESRGLLRTVRCYVVAPGGQKIIARAVLDCGSQVSLVERNLATQLGLNGPSKRLLFEKAGGSNHHSMESLVTFKVMALDGSYTSPPIKASTIEKIANSFDGVMFDPAEFNHLKDLSFTEKMPSNAAPVDLLLAEPIFSTLHLAEKRAGRPGEPIAWKTSLGWVLSGENPDTRGRKINLIKEDSDETPPKMMMMKAMLASSNNMDKDLEQDFKRFIQQESLEATYGDDHEYTIEDSEAVKLLDQVLQYDEKKKQWTTRLLWKKDSNPETDLTNNRGRAIKIAESVYRRMDEKQKEQAEKELQTLLDNDFIEEIPQNEVTNNRCYYVELLTVFRDDAETTKCRLVFNLSSKSSATGKSLNDLTYAGPSLLPAVATTQVRYRLSKYLLKYDLSKCFLRILLHPEERDWHRFVWMTPEGIKYYRSKTILFGSNSSPFIASFVIKKTAEMFKDKYPKGYESISSDLYMDDGTTHGDDPNEVVQTFNEVKAIMEAAGQKPHKVASNSPEVLQHIDPSLLGDQEKQSLLGMIWNPQTDTLKFNFVEKLKQKQDVSSRRTSLGSMTSCYDPVGFMGPIIAQGKRLMQHVWKQSHDWDEELPQHLQKEFQRWVKIAIHTAQSFEIPRYIGMKFGGSDTELMIFADASLDGYGAVAYVVNKSERKAQFIFSKSRIAPKNSTVFISKDDATPVEDKIDYSIARLELCACQLAVQVGIYLSTHLGTPKENIKYFTDSLVNLARLRKGPESYKVYVANRVRFVVENSQIENWFYIQTGANPADQLTKLHTKDRKQANELWFNLNNYVRDKPKSAWVKPTGIQTAQQKDQEVKPTIQFLNVRQRGHPLDALSEKTSNWGKLCRIVAYVLYWRLKHKDYSFTQCLTLAKYKLIEQAQIDDYKTERDSYGKMYKYPKTSTLKASEENLTMRHFGVTTEDRTALLCERARIQGFYPIILPKHPTTEKIIMDAHERVGHTLFSTVLADLWSEYKIIGGKRYIKKVLSQCKHPQCRKFKNNSQLMGYLPRFRVTSDTAPFTYIMLDHIGPVFPTKAGSAKKCYILTVTCLQTRALHMELAESLETEELFQCLYRMIMIRGIPSVIYSDNSQTFLKAGRMLGRIRQQQKSYIFSNKWQVEWRFGVPEWPQGQGAIERLNRTVKDGIKKSIAKKKMTIEQFKDVLLGVQAIVNDRPLAQPDESDTPISPNHLCYGRPLLVGKVEVHSMGTGVLNFWRKKSSLMNDFWRNWSNSYIRTLQTRQKWRNIMNPVPKEGDVVMLKEKNLAKGQWRIARVREVLKDASGLERSVMVDLPDRKRPVERHISLVSILESSAEESRHIQKVHILREAWTRGQCGPSGIENDLPDEPRYRFHEATAGRPYC